jgi:CheY-like chemotaxis protein
MKPPLPKSVLLIEDDAALSAVMATSAREAGFQVWTADTADDGLARAKAFKPAVIFCDVHLDKGDGRMVLTKVRADDAIGDCQFVLMTGDLAGAPQRDSIALEADSYLAKPFSVVEFSAVLAERYRQANL